MADPDQPRAPAQVVPLAETARAAAGGALDLVQDARRLAALRLGDVVLILERNKGGNIAYHGVTNFLALWRNRLAFSLKASRNRLICCIMLSDGMGCYSVAVLAAN